MMAILQVEELTGRAITRKDRGITEHTRSWVLTTDDLRQSRKSILDHPEVPKPFVDFHDEDGTALCTSTEATQRTAGYQWSVSANYSNEFEAESENPLKRPAIIDLTSEEYERVATVDRHGKPTINTAGQYFSDPPVMQEDSRWIITVSKNVAQWPRWLLSYQNAINDGNIRIKGVTWPRHTLMLKRLKIPHEQVENNKRFVEVSFELHYRREGWARRPLNRGVLEKYYLRELDEKGNRTGAFAEAGIRPIIERGGTGQVSEPVFLDRFGQAFREIQNRVDDPKHPTGALRSPKPHEIIALEFDVAIPRPFSRLPLR